MDVANQDAKTRKVKATAKGDNAGKHQDSLLPVAERLAGIEEESNSSCDYGSNERVDGDDSSDDEATSSQLSGCDM